MSMRTCDSVDVRLVRPAVLRRRERRHGGVSYVSTKCLDESGRHCDCVTGPLVQNGGVLRVNRGYSQYCACPCHFKPGREREELDRRHIGYRALIQQQKGGTAG